MHELICQVVIKLSYIFGALDTAELICSVLMLDLLRLQIDEIGLT